MGDALKKLQETSGKQLPLVRGLERAAGWFLRALEEMGLYEHDDVGEVDEVDELDEVDDADDSDEEEPDAPPAEVGMPGRRRG